MRARKILAIALAVLPGAVIADDYIGTLKAPPTGLTPQQFLYSFSTSPLEVPGSTPRLGDQPYRLKLGYQYSRYLAVESEFLDGLRNSPEPFASPGNLTSAFRASGYGVDTVATLPVWRFSFYGRMGAYRGDARNAFGFYSTSLLADSTRARWRYGLGMRYDITKSVGVRAEMERYTPMGGAASFAGEPESDLFSLGVSWRF